MINLSLSTRAVMRRRLYLDFSSWTFTRSMSSQSQAVGPQSDGGIHKAKPFHEIPGDNPKLWFLNAAKLLLKPGGISKNAMKYLENNYKTYGALHRDNNNPYFETVVVVNPEDAETVLRTEAKYPVRFEHLPFAAFRKSRKKPAGVFFADGEEWYKHRSVVSKKMLRPKEMSSYSVDMNEIVSDFIDHVRQVREPAGSENEFEVKHLDNSLFRWSFEGVSNFVFDRRFGALKEPMPDPRGQKFINAIQGFLETFIDVSLVPMSVYKYYETQSYKKFIESSSTMYFFVESLMEEAVHEMKDHDVKDGERVKFLEFLLLSGKLQADDLVASVVDLMFAGVDTTSNTVHWSLYLLGKNPDKLKKLEEEIHSVLKPGEFATQENVQHTPYLKAVVKETLRLYPVVNQLPRIIPEDMILSGYHIPANTQVFMSFTLMGREAKLFPDPEAFIPERWLEATPEQSKFASLPFGFGVRMCVGRRLAELEMHLLLARLVQEFKMEYPSGEDIPRLFRGLPIPEKNVRIKFYDR